MQIHSHWKKQKEVGSEFGFAALDRDGAAASGKNMLGELKRGGFQG